MNPPDHRHRHRDQAADTVTGAADRGTRALVGVAGMSAVAEPAGVAS